MKIAVLTNEYPPNVYGGAGVHVEYLTEALARMDNGVHDVCVSCFADQNVVVPETNNFKHAKLFDTLARDLSMAAGVVKADVVHGHTWYSHMAGLLVKQLHNAPLVLTTHSLEPHRPWKTEQLGTAYNVSSWIEKTAYQNADGVIAVSESMKHDVMELYGVAPDRIRVIHNGIDLKQYSYAENPALLDKYGIDRNIPYILFVGRITRQKGIVHLVNAIKYIEKGIQIVLCAGAPDTPGIEKEMREKVVQAKNESSNNIIWISDMLSKKEIISLYSHAEVFVCPSVYEPFGIINLEAMSCNTPVVASAVGGIPEVVIHGQTGLLVPITHRSETDPEPEDAELFAKNLADAVNNLISSPDRVREMGRLSRLRVEEYFSWDSIAAKTLDFYKELI